MLSNVEVVVDVAEWFISCRITPHNFLYRSRQDQSSAADYLILTDMIMIQLSAVSIKCFMKVFRVNLCPFFISYARSYTLYTGQLVLVLNWLSYNACELD